MITSLYDFRNKLSPLESRAGISLEDHLDDYSVVSGLFPEDNQRMIDSFNAILDDPGFSKIHPINLLNEYHRFSTAWWREVLQKRKPNEENSLAYLIYLIVRENLLSLMSERRQAKNFFKKDYAGEKRALQKSLALHEYALSYKIKTPKIQKELVRRAVKNIKEAHNFSSDEEAERFLSISIHNQRK